MAELVFLTTVIIMYGGINFYLYLRVQASLISWFPGITPIVFTILFWTLASIFLITQISRHILGYSLPVIIVKIGYYWLAVLFYALLLVATIDLWRLLIRWLPWLPSISDFRTVSLITAVLVLVIVGYGVWNSRHPVITKYNVVLNKPSPLTELHVVMVSDIHLGLVVDKKRLVDLVSNINSLQPDLVLLPGDVIDEDLNAVVKAQMDQELRNIKAKYGVYACLGNHEYYSGKIDEVDSFLKRGHITLLRDQVVTIADSIYLAGRSMRSENPLERDKSARLNDLLVGIDHSRPLLVMDHVPARITEAASAKVDLLVCGHTHLGQLWPLNQITRRVFLADYGHYQAGSFQALISNGVGTWGPPIRVGNRPEIVDITLRFSK